MTGPELVQITLEKVSIIHQRLKAAFSSQKSYVDPKRKEMSFSLGDSVFLKVSLMKGELRFGIKRKLAQRYTGSFEIRLRV